MPNLVLFCGAALALLLVPGPSVLFIVARSVEHGRRAGLVSVLGIHAGSLVHVVAAAVGLSAILTSSALAFAAVKYVGAAYLLWLGLRRWRSKPLIVDHDRPPAPFGADLDGWSESPRCAADRPVGGDAVRQRTLSKAGRPPRRAAPTANSTSHLARLFRQGFVVNLLNPKTALFFLAFLPQFVSVERGHVPAQVVLLGLIFIALGMVSDGTYALLASSLGRWLKRSPRATKAEPIVSGGVYVGLGVATALSSGRLAHASR